ERLARVAAVAMTGFASSIIACGCEAGVEGIGPETTPDGRPGGRVLLFARSREGLQDQVVRGVRQCVRAAATCSCLDRLPSEETVRLGSMLRFFGDGHQTSKLVDEALASLSRGAVRPRRFWRLPVLDGECILDDRCGVRKGVAGGNFLILGSDRSAALAA